MEEIINSIKFSAWWWAIVLPLVCMAADVATGRYQAKINRTLSSKNMWDGIYKKLMMIAVLIVLLTLGFAAPQFWTVYIGIALWDVIYELDSIKENLLKAGIKLPTWMIEGLSIATDLLDDGKINNQPRNEVQTSIMRTFDGKEGKDNE